MPPRYAWSTTLVICSFHLPEKDLKGAHTEAISNPEYLGKMQRYDIIGDKIAYSRYNTEPLCKKFTVTHLNLFTYRISVLFAS